MNTSFQGRSILIVEDEPSLVRVLTQGFQESGYQVDSVGNGRQGRDQLLAGNHSLGIIDLMLPEMDGFELIANVRASGQMLPLLVVSARYQVGHKVRALELGADDYLAKPFKSGELHARVRALLRRASMPALELKVADLVLNPKLRTVRRGGRRVVLSPKEFAVLELLMRNPGRPVSKETLLKQVWSEKEPPNGNVIEVYIGYLRQKTEEGGATRLIETVRGQGYELG